jgi:hypothetical protein
VIEGLDGSRVFIDIGDVVLFQGDGFKVIDKGDIDALIDDQEVLVEHFIVTKELIIDLLIGGFKDGGRDNGLSVAL